MSMNWGKRKVVKISVAPNALTEKSKKKLRNSTERKPVEKVKKKGKTGTGCSWKTKVGSAFPREFSPFEKKPTVKSRTG